ncbi:type VII secretion target [Nocardia asteroides]|uniref:type VII secretion target n=1 Tax=Nocardia asteroides TaxID=1824 RepID=UPI001E44AA6C|nr:type VII secretion target [Nocardia asteroides]UGT60002.1 hypothetical protein LTT61_22635 [Nocardia asteroides]
MNHVAVVPEAVRRYGDASASMAAGIATAGAVDQVATVAAVVPVFGLIGQEFLAAYAVAQANHIASLLELAGVHAGTALTAYEAAATYEATDSASGAAIGAVERQ